MGNSINRIEKLREHALNLKFDNSEWYYLYSKGYLESCSKEFTTVGRYAMATEHMLSNVEPVIDDLELIVGKQSNRKLTEEELSELKNMQKYLLPSLSSISSSAHMSVDYELLLTKGVQGILQDIDDYISKLDMTNSRDLEKYEFYRACKNALNGLIVLSDKYSDLAFSLAKDCKNEERRKELMNIGEICRKVPRKSAETFYEAVQAVHFLNMCLSIYPFGLYQLGRPDRYLLEYYKNDTQNNIITKEFASELIDCLCIIFNEYIFSGLAVGFMVGGRNEFGKDITNELTYMFIRSIEKTRMVYPGIGLCYNKETPEDLLELCSEMLGKGYSHPALFNDDVIINGLKQYNVPENEAFNYIHSTCVEITPNSASSCWVASPYTNLVQLLLDTLGVKAQNSEPKEYLSFEEFKNAFYENLGERVKQDFINHNRGMIERTKNYFQPLLSCFVNDCLKKGMDIESGGAKYNWIMPSFIGLANVADSFGVINEHIFKQKTLTFSELANILEKNYEGFDDKRLSFLNLVDKYGNDIDEADNFVKEISETIKGKCLNYINYRGGELIPSLFCWVMHDTMGSQTMASPDGRLEGFPLGDGSGPAQGREKSGATASVLSSTKWEHSAFIGGIAVNMKFGKKIFNEESKQKLMALIRTFMKRGGFEMQINVVDKEVLLKARENPELYSDLVVRIGGYSDYFVRLSKSMQAEVIERTENII